jgi:hypothetical protein
MARQVTAEQVEEELANVALATLDDKEISAVMNPILDAIREWEYPGPLDEEIAECERLAGLAAGLAVIAEARVCCLTRLKEIQQERKPKAS